MCNSRRPPLACVPFAASQRTRKPASRCICPFLRNKRTHRRCTRVRPRRAQRAARDDFSKRESCRARSSRRAHVGRMSVDADGAHSPHARTTATCTPNPAPFAHAPAAVRRFLIHDIKCRLNCFQSVAHREELNRRKRIQMPNLTDLERVRSARSARGNRDSKPDSAACGNAAPKAIASGFERKKAGKHDENLH